MLHTDFFSLASPDKQWRSNITCQGLSEFAIVYDAKKMYAQTGVQVTLQGEGKESVQVSDDGEGMIRISVSQGADGKNLTIVVQPKGR